MKVKATSRGSRSVNAFDDNGCVCRDCKEYKEYSKICKSIKNPNGYDRICYECQRVRNKKYLLWWC